MLQNPVKCCCFRARDESLSATLSPIEIFYRLGCVHRYRLPQDFCRRCYPTYNSKTCPYALCNPVPGDEKEKMANFAKMKVSFAGCEWRLRRWVGFECLWVDFIGIVTRSYDSNIFACPTKNVFRNYFFPSPLPCFFMIFALGEHSMGCHH